MLQSHRGSPLPLDLQSAFRSTGKAALMDEQVDHSAQPEDSTQDKSPSGGTRPIKRLATGMCKLFGKFNPVPFEKEAPFDGNGMSLRVLSYRPENGKPKFRFDSAKL